MMERRTQYLVWSIEHNAWWKPNHRGYTQNIVEAGIYTYDEAVKICAGANWFIGKDGSTINVPNEAMVPMVAEAKTKENHG